MLAFKKQFLYKYMEEKPAPQPPPQPQPCQPQRQGMPERLRALPSSLPQFMGPPFCKQWNSTSFSHSYQDSRHVYQQWFLCCPGSRMRSARSAQAHGAGGILGNDSGLKPRKFPSLRQPQNQSNANAMASHSSNCN